MAALLSALEKADLARARSSSFSLNLFEARSCPSQVKCAVRSSSDTIDAGSLDAFPSTACSGLYPWTMESVFFAWKHWYKASSNYLRFVIGCS